MVKEWFINIDGKEHGPLSIRDLKRHPEISPDTLVRHVTWTEWRRIRQVPELKEVFEEKKPSSSTDEEEDAAALQGSGAGELILDADQGNFPFYIWVLIALLVLLYTWYQLKYF